MEDFKMDREALKRLQVILSILNVVEHYLDVSEWKTDQETFTREEVKQIVKEIVDGIREHAEVLASIDIDKMPDDYNPNAVLNIH